VLLSDQEENTKAGSIQEENAKLGSIHKLWGEPVESPEYSGQLMSTRINSSKSSALPSKTGIADADDVKKVLHLREENLFISRCSTDRTNVKILVRLGLHPLHFSSNIHSSINSTSRLRPPTPTIRSMSMTHLCDSRPS